MTTPALIIRSARTAAGLTQQQLAERMGTTQSAVARLERGTTDPRFSTVEQAVRATGRRVQVTTPAAPATDVDETLLASNLRLSAADRVRRFRSAYRRAQQLAVAGARARGELA